MTKSVTPKGAEQQRECRRVYYSGRVQGVGFRFTSQHLAHGFNVGGYVRNLPDGRVELVAEGDPAELDGFLQSLQHAMGRYIHEVAVESFPVSPDSFTGFTIRYSSD